VFVLAGCVVLSASGCGGGKAQGVVDADLGRVGHAFPGWRVLPYSSSDLICRDTAGGPPTATAARHYVYPARQNYRAVPYPFNSVYVTVEYHSAANAARDVSGYGLPGSLGCVRTTVEKGLASYYHRVYGPPNHPANMSCCTVRVTEGPPQWLAHILGPKAHGYQEVNFPPRTLGLPSMFGVLFIYRDPKDPHVTYHVGVWAANPHGTQTTPAYAEATIRRHTLTLIRGIR